MKNVTSTLILSIFFAAQVVAQGVYVNRVYEERSGSPQFNPILNQFGIEWSRSLIGSGGNLFVVGHTSVSGQGENIFLKKIDPTGAVLFSVTFNSGGTQNDFGINLYEAPNGDVYVCGAAENGSPTNYDAVVLRYSSAEFS